MKKLWTGNVSIDFEMAIYAETEQEALRLAKKHAREELENLDGLDITVAPGAPSSDLDDALPWGDFGSGHEQTVGELKEKLGVQSPKDTLLARAREAAAKEGASK